MVKLSKCYSILSRSSVEALGLEPGDVVAIEGHMMSHADDWVGQGNNKAYLIHPFLMQTGHF